nr:unnamed protein product [Callosobruchus chinensis]
MQQNTGEDPQQDSLKEKGVSITEGNLLYSKLQCVQCGQCLSVKPVSEKDGRFTCGRCFPEAKQCPLYAAVAEHLKFTCIFRNCEVELTWEDVRSHEEKCLYRDVSCPFPECIDRYQFISYQSHFKHGHALHEEPYFSDTLSLERSTSSTPHMDLHCMFYRGNIFLVFMKIHKQLCCGKVKGICQFNVFSLSSVEDRANLNCEIRVSMYSDAIVTKTMSSNDVKDFIDTEHCLTCLSEFCDKPEHTNSGDRFLNNELEFSTKSMSYSYEIQFYKKNYLKALLPKIECPICNNDFSEPIYLCPTGHSLCIQCYTNVTECPFCRQGLPREPIRNFAFEELIRECRDTNRN